MAIFFRCIKNILPTPELKYKCHVLKNHYIFLSKNYKFFTIPEYCKEHNIPERAYESEAGKIYVLNDFLIDFFADNPYVHDGKGNILNESFPYNNKVKHLFLEEYIKQDTNNIKYLEKAMYCAMKSGKNYWHFTFTVLDQIYAMEKKGFDGKYLLWNSPFIKQLVALLGVSRNRMEFVEEGDRYHIKELHIIEDYCWGSPKNPVLLYEMREKILSNIDMSDIVNYPKNLYIRRIRPYSRAVKNEAEVMEWLNKYNFQAIFPDDYSVAEQIKYFYAADIIICPHGGCSTNVLFMKRNSHFIESFGFNYVNPCMLDIIKINGMSYNMLVERGEACDVADASSDYNIDMKLLEDTIYKYLPDYSKV